MNLRHAQFFLVLMPGASGGSLFPTLFPGAGTNQSPNYGLRADWR